MAFCFFCSFPQFPIILCRMNYHFEKISVREIQESEIIVTPRMNEKLGAISPKRYFEVTH